jgi:hypothetical protein
MITEGPLPCADSTPSWTSRFGPARLGPLDMIHSASAAPPEPRTRPTPVCADRSQSCERTEFKARVPNEANGTLGGFTNEPEGRSAVLPNEANGTLGVSRRTESGERRFAKRSQRQAGGMAGGMATASWPCGGATASKTMPTKTWACHPDRAKLGGLPNERTAQLQFYQTKPTASWGVGGWHGHGFVAMWRGDGLENHAHEDVGMPPNSWQAGGFMNETGGRVPFYQTKPPASWGGEGRHGWSAALRIASGPTW